MRLTKKKYIFLNYIYIHIIIYDLILLVNIHDKDGHDEHLKIQQD